ncbi:hypothetical protein MSG28_011674 [Choristoneura fumiferana]|uniref:Uncharacterized protein n=1 Tax=Choristoneura fumiferana TaxID=7141 RepID=A0ACC0KLD1_CHOFU|nr:hypothetical protein MSG28_011674 [Choristoneura fumiferana]
MLSRVALRSAAARQSASTALVARGSATDVAGVRDEKNFPRPVRGEPGKVRLGFVPEEWFQFFHSKTGVTGPYTFGVGLATYLCSKEIYVMEHEYYSGLSLLVMIYVAAKKLGPSISAYLDKEVDLEKSNLERRLAQRHMVDWIVTNVTKAITPDQEKQTLDRCIADLAALAPRN